MSTCPQDRLELVYQRRAFLRLAAAGIGGAVVTVGTGCVTAGGPDRVNGEPSDSPDLQVDLREVLVTYFGRGPAGGADEAAALSDPALLGALFVTAFAGSQVELQAALGETTDLLAGVSTTAAAVIALDDAVVADFEQARLRSISGWQLARTEVHLCALAHQQSDDLPRRHPRPTAPSALL